MAFFSQRKPYSRPVWRSEVTEFCGQPTLIINGGFVAAFGAFVAGFLSNSTVSAGAIGMIIITSFRFSIWLWGEAASIAHRCRQSMLSSSETSRRRVRHVPLRPKLHAENHDCPASPRSNSSTKRTGHSLLRIQLLAGCSGRTSLRCERAPSGP
jgi:hypothetical protein